MEAELDDDAESIITTERYDWIEGVMRRCVVKAPKALTTSEKIDRVVTNRVLGLPIFVCAESIITTERYDWIEGVMRRCVVKAPKALTTSEKIDRVVTNRVLGLPIFVCVMVLVYYLAVSTVGTWGTDWANDGLFGDGWFLSPAAAQSYEEAQGAYDDEDYGTVVDEYLAAADAAGVDTDGVAEPWSTSTSPPPTPPAWTPTASPRPTRAETPRASRPLPRPRVRPG